MEVSRREKESGIIPDRSLLLGTSLSFNSNKETTSVIRRRKRKNFEHGIVASSSNVAAPIWESWKPQKGSSNPSLSDILWPSAGNLSVLEFLSLSI